MNRNVAFVGDQLLTLKVFSALAKHSSSSRSLADVFRAMMPFLVVGELPFVRASEQTNTLELSDAERYSLTSRCLVLASRLLELAGIVADDIPLLIKASSDANCAIKSSEQVVAGLRNLTEYCEMMDKKKREEQEQVEEYEKELNREIQKVEGEEKGISKGSEENRCEASDFFMSHELKQTTGRPLRAQRRSSRTRRKYSE